jgi:thymidylate synthase (FAD)
MQALATAPLVKMASSNKFIMPETISANPELKADFEKCIKENRRVYTKLLSENINPYLLVYVAPHATAIDFVTTVNARELLHLSNLRTCTRAQWQIRYLVTDMLKLVKKTDPKMFECFGPSCYTYGVCPEGRMCCGKQQEMKKMFDEME